MKKCTLILLCCLFAFVSTKGETKDKASAKRFNFGFIAGVNAPFISTRRIYVDWVEKDTPNSKSSIGGMLSFFGRANIKKSYLQLEIGTSFFKTSSNIDDYYLGIFSVGSTVIDTKQFTLDIPILYGYNFIKRDPYELSLFAGPKMRYTYKYNESFKNSGDLSVNIDEDINPISACFIVGMATKISRFILDFRYEFAITVQNKPGRYTVYDGTNIISAGSIYNKRAINLLSFSLGVIL